MSVVCLVVLEACAIVSTTQGFSFRMRPLQGRVESICHCEKDLRFFIIFDINEECVHQVCCDRD